MLFHNFEVNKMLETTPLKNYGLIWDAISHFMHVHQRPHDNLFPK